MEPWFDRATKFLASGSVPRRSLLQSAVVAAASTLLSKMTAVAAAPREVAQTIRPIQPLPGTGPCTLRDKQSDTTITFSAQATYQGKPLTLRGVQNITGRRYPSTTWHAEVAYGGAPLLDVEYSAVEALGPNRQRASTSEGVITYGPAVRGMRRVQSVQSGGTVTGFMDGRGFTADVRTPTAFRMADRRPAPVAAVDAGLAVAVRTLFVNAGHNIQTCRRIADTRPAGTARRAMVVAPHDDVPRRTLLAEGVPSLARQGAASRAPQSFSALAAGGPNPPMAQDSPVLAAQASSGACADCVTRCKQNASACFSNAGNGCSFSVCCMCCWMANLANCEAALATCIESCYQAGGPCCNKQCTNPSNPASQFCCAFDETCCEGNACCSQTKPVCFTYSGGFGICCPSASVQCGPVPPYGAVPRACCPASTTCCGTACCDEQQTCANIPLSACCPKGQTFCAGACCNGTCIQDALGNQSCCPPHLACGSTCCDSGARCVNGQCGYGQPCGKTFCGVANPVCCNGVCCASNQACVNGRCTGATCPPGQVPCAVTPNQCCPEGLICCGGGPTGHSCCNPATQICCGGRGCLPTGSQCVQ